MKPRNRRDVRLLAAVVNSCPHVIFEFEEKWRDIKLQINPQILTDLEEVKMAFFDLYVSAYTNGIAFNCDFLIGSLRRYTSGRTGIPDDDGSSDGSGSTIPAV